MHIYNHFWSGGKACDASHTVIILRRTSQRKMELQNLDAQIAAISNRNDSKFKNLLTPLFLMGCFPVAFQEVKRPLRTKSGKRPIKVGKRPINEGKRPIKAMVLVGVSVDCLMGCLGVPLPWVKTAPLKRPIKRSTRNLRAPAKSQPKSHLNLWKEGMQALWAPDLLWICLGNVPSAKTTTDSLIWWIIRCYIYSLFFHFTIQKRDNTRGI